MDLLNKQDIKLFVTYRRVEGEGDYVSQMKTMIAESERLNFEGILFFQNNSNDIEPWVLGQEILTSTATQNPIIAVNPAYMHPYTVAQKIVSYTTLYQRKIYLNFIIGTSISDLASIGDHLSHEERYKRLEEYIEIIYALLKNTTPVTYKGTYYETNNLKLSATINPALFPESFIAGSSDDAKRLRAKMELSNLKMGKPVHKCVPTNENTGMYLGIIARETQEEAIAVMKQTFAPEYEEYDELLEMSMMNTDANWKQNLLTEEADAIFKMEPFKHFSADCPYLVGSYEQVEEYLGKYIELGINRFVIDTDLNEMKEIAKVFNLVHAV